MQTVNVLIGCEMYNETLEKNIKGALNFYYSQKDTLVNTVFTYTAREYEECIKKGIELFDATLIVESLNAGFVYCLQTYFEKYNNRRYVVVIPDNLRSSRMIASLYDMGIYNALYQSHTSTRYIKECLDEERTRLEAIEYYGIDALLRGEYRNDNPAGTTAVAPIDFGENEVEKVETIKTKYGDITVHRVLSSGIEKRRNKSLTDDILNSLIDDNFNIDSIPNEDSELMDIYNVAADTRFQEHVSAVIKGLIEWMEGSEGSHIASAFRMKSIGFEYIDSNASKYVPGYEVLSLEERKIVYDELVAYYEGYELITPLIYDKDVSDIRILSPNDIHVKVKGKWFRADIQFRDKAAYDRYMTKIIGLAKGALSRADAQAVFTETKLNPKYKLRISLSHEMLQANGYTLLHMRKIDKVKKLVKELLKEGLFTLPQISLLIKAIQNKKSIVIGGASGSGKTVLMNLLLEYFDNDTCGIILQEADELDSKRLRNVSIQHPVVGKGDSKINYTLANMAAAALLQNTELFIIGEVKGPEAYYIGSACDTGCITMYSIHALTLFEIIPRTADLAEKGNPTGATDTARAVSRMLARSIDYVVHMDGYHVNSIAKVVGWAEEKEEIIYDVYEFPNL